MAGSPELKIFNPQGEYIGCVKYGEDAACLVSSYGDGATVRYGHSKKMTVWTQGSEEFSAGESYDRCRDVILARIKAFWDVGHMSKE